MCCFLELGLISWKLDVGYESFGVDRPNAGLRLRVVLVLGVNSAVKRAQLPDQILNECFCLPRCFI